MPEWSTRPCPRCHDQFDDTVAAASRATEEREIYVCGRCGSDEAGYALNGLKYPLVAEWPVRRRYGSDLRRLD